ncbi:MAG TPA: polyketide synthase, partial [Ktedonobacteraceae bacterium]
MSEIIPFNSLDHIAVIGMACRFPGARNVREFWSNLQHGVESITFFSPEELADLDPDLRRDPHFVPARAVIDDASLFDAAFFGYTPREAQVMDPQQRIFLECAWEALEDAGYAAHSPKERIGIYAGAAMNTYLLQNARELAEDFFQMATSNDKDFLASRVAYKLNLCGPAVTVQTACSTSLVAVHLACQGLLGGECEMALAGGISLNLPQKAGYLYQEGGIFSPDGHCRAFDSEARGTVNGDGVGLVVLKRLDDALKAGDSIIAVVRGSAINNDGSHKVGFTAPSIEGQAAVITEAQNVAQVDADSLSYIEAHGTATPLGDPIEVLALNRAFRRQTTRSGFCALGSVKTNIGHVDVAAGVAGLIKTLLALKYRQIPPSLHFHVANPHIDFAQSPFYVNTQLIDWPVGPTPRRAGVSSFGIGGTNAHVILEEAPQNEEVSRRE